MLKPAFRIAGLVVILLCSLAPVRAQTPAPDVAAAAAELLGTMKLDQQFKALLPMMLKTMKPAIVQNRPAVERDFDALTAPLMAGFDARISELVEAVTIIYANNFSAEELRAATAFYRTPAG